MTDRHQRVHELLLQDLAELKLAQIAAVYRELLDEAARKNTPLLEMLAHLFAAEVTARRERAVQRRSAHAFSGKRPTVGSSSSAWIFGSWRVPRTRYEFARGDPVQSLPPPGNAVSSAFQSTRGNISQTLELHSP